MITKDQRIASRNSTLKSFGAEVTEYPDADAVIGRIVKDNGTFEAMYFFGTAGKPKFYFSYRSAERMEADIAERLNNRRSYVAEKAAAKGKSVPLSGAALTAKKIREELKTVFTGVKFSVTSSIFSGGDSVDIRWTDGPVEDLVKHITRKYQCGSFDGMTDCYNYAKIDPSLGCDGADYVQCSRTRSSEKIAVVAAAAILAGEPGAAESNFNGWYYENTHPETWEPRYQDLKIKFDAEDAAAREEDQQTDETQTTDDTPDATQPTAEQPAEIVEPIENAPVENTVAIVAATTKITEEDKIMSCYVVSYKTINSVLTGLQDFPQVLDTIPGEDLSGKGRYLVMLNISAYEALYHDSRNDYTEAEIYSYAEVERQRLTQFYKSLQCLTYQLSQGNIMVTRVYKALHGLATLIKKFNPDIEATPEYEAAIWG